MSAQRGEVLTGWRIYSQIADRLRSRIIEGVYPQGTFLPSGKEVAAEFRVARNTARRALRVLVAEGLVTVIPSQGHRVLTEQARRLDRRNLAEAIAEELREQISSGQLPAGSPMPDELALCERYGAARRAVRQVLRTLAEEGLIVSVRGKGRFVRPGPA